MRRWVGYAAVPVLALVIGIGVGLASSMSSLTQGHHVLGTPAPDLPMPSQAVTASPPTVTQPGILGNTAHLTAAGSASLAAAGVSAAAATADGGKTWSVLRPPAKASGVAIDPGNPAHGVVGGSSIQVTVDGGANWKLTQTSPPGPAPYQPIQVSPFDSAVWFFVHGGKLLRTRDGGLTWHDIGALPALGAPVLAAGQVFGQFYLTSGSSVFELIDNGQQVTALPSLPSSSTVTELAVVGGTDWILFARSANGSYLLKGGAWSALTSGAGGPIAAGNGIIMVGNGGGQLGAAGVVSYSADGGATWHQGFGLPYDQTVEALAGQPASFNFFAYCYGGDVYASTDGGATWTVMSRALRNRAG
jgi:photosystem II stability/assembly factor-like uncharacterized protein